MALTKLTENLNTHQSLPDQPSLTSEELKIKWDEAPNKIKEYINQILIQELDGILENKVDKAVGKILSTNDFTDAFKTKLDNIEENANKYTHPSTAGNKHIPKGGSNGQILRWSADGTAVWGQDNNTTYNAVTTTANGLMTKEDKIKLNGIATGSTKNTVENNLDSLSTTNALSAIQGKYLNEKIIGTQLYANASGSNGTITLNESSANFAVIEIMFKDKDYNPYASMRIRNPNGKNVLLSMPHTFGKEQTVITATKEITIKNKTISVVNYGVHNAWNNSILNTNRIYIYSIWGWKR